MIEIIPNWHPVFVHFTIGLLLTGSALFLAGYLYRNSNTGTRITTAARWNLGIGAAFAVVTVATGFQAYYSVAHDAPSHAAMTVHLKWASVAFVLFGIAAILAWRDRRRFAGASLPLSAVLLAAALSLAVTGFLGGENVYRHGLGVMRLPEASGPGHSHSHDGGEEHDHGSSAAEDDANADGADHDHANGSRPPSATGGHEHAEPQTPEAVLDAFHHALKEGDGQAALRWLADDAVILEGGVLQTKEEYRAEHLGSDMAFTAAMQTEERLSRETRQADGVVTVMTRTRLKGTFKDRELDLISSETAVLTQTSEGWKIQHLHWSS